MFRLVHFCSFPLLISILLLNAPPAAALAPRPPAASVPLLEVRSAEQDGLLTAEVAGNLPVAAGELQHALTRVETWCEFLPLVFNIKSCTFETSAGSTWLDLYVGRKFYETPQEAIRIRYRFNVREAGPELTRIELTADEGPAGTRDYRIDVEATPAGAGTALRMRSSFRPSLRSQLATKAYLATSGRGKVGFSIQGYDGDTPVYVGGVKGVIERNAMRYYLALRAYFDTAGLSPAERFDARLRAWYEATARYRQLYEMERQEYLQAKRAERRQQELLQSGAGCG